MKKDTNISFDPYYWDTHELTNPGETNLLDQVLNNASGLTTKFEINYPLLRRSSDTNIMVSPEEWLSTTTGWHEPVHVAQYGLYPHVFEDGTYTYNFLGQQ